DGLAVDEDLRPGHFALDAERRAGDALLERAETLLRGLLEILRTALGRDERLERLLLLTHASEPAVGLRDVVEEGGALAQLVSHLPLLESLLVLAGVVGDLALLKEDTGIRLGFLRGGGERDERAQGDQDEGDALHCRGPLRG